MIVLFLIIVIERYISTINAMSKVYLIPLILSKNLEMYWDQFLGRRVSTGTKQHLIANAMLLILNDSIFIKTNTKK